MSYTESYFNDPTTGTLRDNQAPGTFDGQNLRDIASALFDPTTIQSIVLQAYAAPVVQNTPTIPSSPTPVSITLSNNNLLQAGTSTKGSIQGIFGLLTNTAGTYRFTRDVAGGAITVPSNSQFIPGYTAATNPTNIVITSSSIALAASQSFVVVQGSNLGVVLPPASAVGVYGKDFTVKNYGSSTNTSVTSAGGTIEGNASVVVTSAGSAITFVSDGSTWIIKSRA
jgi:hypothetical protein